MIVIVLHWRTETRTELTNCRTETRTEFIGKPCWGWPPGTIIGIGCRKQGELRRRIIKIRSVLLTLGIYWVGVHRVNQGDIRRINGLRILGLDS